MLDRKPANTLNGMLVKPNNALASSAYYNIAFSSGLAKKEIAGVEQLTA
ncbi:MAG TPA: hypothetical protein VN328_13635 [Thermodesulfovibrionales bacterium]|nr:hypothetical protein [Thermodesulfovibrionales bacterium]